MLTITKVERQKKRPERCSVFIGGEFAFGVHFSDLERLGLDEDSVNVDITEEKYDKIRDEVLFVKARDCALRYLEYKARSKAEVVRKLTDEGFFDGEAGAAACERVVETLEQYGYIDDEQYCVMFAHDARAVNGFGNDRVRRELIGRGVDRQTIDAFFEGDVYDEAEAAEELLRRHYRRGGLPANCEKDYKEFRKVVDFLLRKGYNHSTAKEVVKRVIEYENEDEN